MIPVWATWSVCKSYALKSTAMSTDHHLAWVHPDREGKGAQESLLEPGNVE